MHWRAALLLALPLIVSPQSLDEAWRQPPRQARVHCYWWWLNGNTNPAAITRDLEEMKAKGYGGAILIDAGGADQRNNDQVPAGPLFGSPEWGRLFAHAVKEADRTGLELSLNILSGWNLGGPRVRPDTAAKLVTWSAVRAAGGQRVELTLPGPPAKRDWYRDIAVLAYPLRHGAAKPGEDQRAPIRQLILKAVFKEAGGSTPVTWPLLDDVPAQDGEQDTQAAQVMDVSAHMDANGRFAWDVPAGEWEILRFGFTPSGSKVSTASGAWQGLVIDYLDRDALQTYWNDTVEPLLAGVKPYLGRSLRYLVTDSWELDGVNWTPRFREEFRRRRGYDLLPYLPVFTGRIVESRAVTNRFLNDVRRTIGDLIADVHYRGFAELSARHGLGIHPESGGPHGAPVDSLQTLGRGAFPQMEFWAKSPIHRVADHDRFFVKEAASAAHIYGKTIVAAEGETTIGPQWEESIWDNLKPTFDRAVCEGLNQLIWHTFTSSPPELGLPGQEYFAGTHLNPNVTWWPQAGAFLAYINRISAVMQQGRPVSDVLYYYGDHVPNFVRLKASDPARVLPGYDYDVANEEVLLTRLTVRDGLLTLPDGVQYRLLVLPERENISPAALKKIGELLRAGASVTGGRPMRATGLTGHPSVDAEIEAESRRLWASCDGRPRKGAVTCGATARQVLGSLGVPPDFEAASGAGASIDYIHRRDGAADIYFVSNQSARPLRFTALFRVAGRAPEFWDAASGRTRDARFYQPAPGGRTAVPLQLDPYGSLLVVFRRPYAKPPAPGAMPQPGRARTVAGPWRVSFRSPLGGPAPTVFPQLISLPTHADAEVRYFSGVTSYETTFSVPAGELGDGRRVTLDLGAVHMLAEVRVNGQDAGVWWKMPFAGDITDFVKSGDNSLEVRVTNLWPNRLIGDQQLAPAQRKTWTNIRKFTKDSPLLPSGLLGPVVLRSLPGL